MLSWVADSTPAECGRSRETARRPGQRILALTTAIWHNDHTSAPVHSSLTACDH